MTTDSIAIVSICLSVVSLLVGVSAFILVLAMKFSTHKIEWRTIGQPNKDGIIEGLEEETEKELKPVDMWGRPVDESVHEFNKLYPDLDQEHV